MASKESTTTTEGGTAATAVSPGGTCPYASVLQQQSNNNTNTAESTATDQSSVSSNDETEESSELLPHSQSLFKTTSNLDNIRSCPAFEQGKKCPFARCHNEEEIRQQLLAMPPSHYHGHGVLQVLQELHNKVVPAVQQQQQQNSNNNSHGNLVLKSCPVASQVPLPDFDFTTAMDEFSLAAIMARMAHQQEQQQQQNEDRPVVPKEDLVGSKEEEKDQAATASSNSDDAGSSTSQLKRGSNENDPQEDQDHHPKLSESFKKGTASSHQAAEDVHFVKNFIKGEIDRDIYAQLILQLYFVYDAMEHCLDKYGSKNHLQQFATFHDKLRRKQSLQEDLEFWHPPKVVEETLRSTSSSSSSNSLMSPATRDYVDRLYQIADQHDPLLLLSHSYTRYLGDLSGGKILARVARRALQLDKTDGLAFYEFDKIKSAKKFKDEYRQMLDTLPLSEPQIHSLVAEANVAFVLNMRIFEELDVLSNVPNARVRPLSEALAFQNDNNNHHQNSLTAKQSGKEMAECPFAKMAATGANESNQNHQAGSSSGSGTTHGTSKRCPWPFILFHDPVQALQDWQTWAVLGLCLCFVWSQFQQK